MGLGLLLIIGAGALFGYNMWDDNRATQESLHDAQAIIEQIEAPEPEIVEMDFQEVIDRIDAELFGLFPNEK